MLGFQSLVTGIQHQKAARAIGALCHPYIETGLAKQGCLLVTRYTEHGHAIKGSTLRDDSEIVG